MFEYTTPAFVLDVLERGESDLQVVLFTRDFGKVFAKVKGARKLSSKLRPHLEIGGRITARLVEKNNMILADTLSFKNRRSKEDLLKHLQVLGLINRLSNQNEADPGIWQHLSSEQVSLTKVLELLGFNIRHAICGGCKSKDIEHFSSFDLSYYCNRCLGRYSKQAGIYKLF